MSEITRTARFRPADAIGQILEEMACPRCGYLDLAVTPRLALGNRVRFFCDGCGAFVTLMLNDAQVEAVAHLRPEDGSPSR